MRKPKLLFRTKAAANQQQEEEFLALSPTERVLLYLRVSQQLLRTFPSGWGRDYGDNWVLVPKEVKGELTWNESVKEFIMRIAQNVDHDKAYYSTYGPKNLSPLK